MIEQTQKQHEHVTTCQLPVKFFLDKRLQLVQHLRLLCIFGPMLYFFQRADKRRLANLCMPQGQTHGRYQQTIAERKASKTERERETRGHHVHGSLALASISPI